MAQWGKLRYAQKQSLGAVGKLMQEAGMLVPGARIGVAVSGGVDSWLLLKILTMRQRIVPFSFELMAVHINPGFAPHNHHPLANWLRTHGISCHIETTDHGPRAHSAENRTRSACFLCARWRRKRLFELCRKYSLSHLALGHTADDLAATFFMNIFQTGKVHGLSMKESYFNGTLELIRPLLYLEKKIIRRAARDFQLPVWENPCPTTHSGNRAKTEKWLQRQYHHDKRIRNNIINALQRWQLDFIQNLD